MRIPRIWAVVVGAVVALAPVGCDNADLTRQLRPEPAVEAEHRAQGLQKLRSGRAAAAAAPSKATRVFGPNGGVLEHDGHRLVVPAGAVSSPTQFSLTSVTDGFVEVDLRALNGKRDVGEEGFAVPVVLQLSYRDAQLPADPAQIAIVWVREDGTMEPLPSRVDLAAQTVTADLDHFSRYAAATN